MNKVGKPVLAVSAFVIMTLLLSCSGIEIQFQPKAMNKRPQKVLIGAFENRIMEYGPFIIKDFRDALKFEFLKLGYDAELLPIDRLKNADSVICSDKKIEYSDAQESQKSKTNPVATSKEAIRSCCEKYSSDMFISGSISIMETSALTDSKTSTFVSVLMYNKTGEQIGEAHYSGAGQMPDANFIKKIAGKFAGEINYKLRKLRK